MQTGMKKLVKERENHEKNECEQTLWYLAKTSDTFFR